MFWHGGRAARIWKCDEINITALKGCAFQAVGCYFVNLFSLLFSFYEKLAQFWITKNNN
jgi:hypothetical protein